MPSEWINIDKLGTKGIEPDLMPSHREPQSFDDAVNVRPVGPNIANAGGYLEVGNGGFPGVPLVDKCQNRGAPDQGWHDPGGDMWANVGSGGAVGVSLLDGRVVMVVKGTTQVRELDGTITTKAPCPLDDGNWAAFAALDNRRIITIGGGNSNVDMIETYIFDVDADSWTLQAPISLLPFPDWLSFGCAARVGNYVYHFGGEADNVKLTGIQRFSILGNSWDTMTAVLPAQSRFGAAVALNSGKIMVVHGQDNVDYKTVSMYLPSTDDFEPVANLPADAEGGASGFLFLLPNGNPYLIAAYDGFTSGGIRTFEYIINTDTWERKQDLPGGYSRNLNSTTGVYLLGTGLCAVWSGSSSQNYYGIPYDEP